MQQMIDWIKLSIIIKLFFGVQLPLNDGELQQLGSVAFEEYQQWNQGWFSQRLWRYLELIL